MTNEDWANPDWWGWKYSNIAESRRALGRPGPTGTYKLPIRLEVAADRIRYWYEDPENMLTPTRWARAGPEQFPDFIALADGKRRDIAQFAYRSGILGLCGHGLPLTHGAGLPTPCGPLGDPDDSEGGWEPLAAWRFYVDQVVTLQNVCADLHRRTKPVPGKTWRKIFDDEGPRVAWNRPVSYAKSGTATVSTRIDYLTGRPALLAMPLIDELEEDRPVWECELRIQRLCAGWIIRSWLEVGRPELSYSWGSEAPSLLTTARSLFAVLAMSLALAAAGSDGFAICSGCTALFVPKPRRGSGDRVYCSACGKKVAQRDAARAYRLRQKTAEPPRFPQRGNRTKSQVKDGGGRGSRV